MKTFLLSLLSILEKMLTKETFGLIVDKILDVIEDWAQGDPATTDDDKTIVLALCAKTRTLIGVPDNDEPAPPPEG